MSFFKTKIDRADKLWSEYLRKVRPACEYCGATTNLTCSHYHGRRKESVRFDEDNCDVLCIKHHMELENEKGWTEGTLNGTKIKLPKKYTQWKMKQLGQVKYDLLMLRANRTVKKDRKFQVLRIKELIKRMEK